MKIRVLILLSLLLTSFATLALENTIENRIQQADRYMSSTPPEEMMQSMASSVSMNLPPEDREGFRALLLEHFNIDVLSEAMKASMVKSFTADEIAALADFYEQPLAKSAMQKMGPYMADIMPIIQGEMTIAVGKMEQAKAEKNRTLPDIEEQ